VIAAALVCWGVEKVQAGLLKNGNGRAKRLNFTADAEPDEVADPLEPHLKSRVPGQLVASERSS